MAKHKVGLMTAIIMALMFFIVTMVFSALAAPGICKFTLHHWVIKVPLYFGFPQRRLAECGGYHHLPNEFSLDPQSFLPQIHFWNPRETSQLSLSQRSRQLGGPLLSGRSFTFSWLWRSSLPCLASVASTAHSSLPYWKNICSQVMVRNNLSALLSSQKCLRFCLLQSCCLAKRLFPGLVP